VELLLVFSRHSSDFTLMLIALQICRKNAKEKNQGKSRTVQLQLQTPGCERNNKHFDVYIFANN